MHLAEALGVIVGYALVFAVFIAVVVTAGGLIIGALRFALYTVCLADREQTKRRTVREVGLNLNAEEVPVEPEGRLTNGAGTHEGIADPLGVVGGRLDQPVAEPVRQAGDARFRGPFRWPRYD